MSIQPSGGAQEVVVAREPLRAAAGAGPSPLQECPVDGHLVPPGDRAAGKFYLFTQVSENEARPGRKTPEEVGRQGLYDAIAAAYGAVFAEGHPCHDGPLFGKVVQEGHASSTEPSLQRLHSHAACAFPAEHKWKAVERHLREVQGVKVHGGPHGLPPDR